MNIFSLLKTDHRNVKSLLHDLTNTPETAIRKRDRLFKKIKQELVVHNEAEESVFYNRLNADRKERVLVFEGKDEHRIGGQILEELSAMDKGTEEWSAKAKVLNDLIKHHIQEEEGEVHKEAKKEFSKEEAIGIGKEFKSLKRELVNKQEGAI